MVTNSITIVLLPKHYKMAKHWDSFLSYCIYQSLNNEQSTSLSKWKIHDTTKTFKQFISHSSTLDLSILQPSDVVVNIYLKTVSYVDGHKSLVPWANAMVSMDTHHPAINEHYILVPLQQRFSWLWHTGFDHYYCQVFDSNPTNSITVYIDCIGCIPTTDLNVQNNNLDTEGEADICLLIMLLSLDVSSCIGLQILRRHMQNLNVMSQSNTVCLALK